MIRDIIDAVRLVTDLIPDPKKKAEAEAVLIEARTRAEELDARLAEAGRDVVVAEATGHSRVQREWRPHFMYLCMVLLFWHAVPLPLLSVALDVPLEALVGLAAVPSGLWTLLTVGMGGYIGARTLEKIRSHDRISGARGTGASSGP